MKKILLALLLLFLITIGVGCNNENEKLPSITNPNSNYFTVVDGGVTYGTSKESMYLRLKNQVGSSTMLDMIDTDLLKAQTKGSTNYWDAITTSDIEEAIDLAVFPNGKDDLTQDEITEKVDAHYNSLLLNNGLLSEVDIFDYYHLTLAKKLYVEDIMRARYTETDFKDTEYQSFYDNNYKVSYYALIVDYPTQKTLDDALLQLNVKIVSGVWQNATSQVALTDEEVMTTLIGLYNMKHAYEVSLYPNETLALKAGVHYTNTSSIVFDLDKINDLFYSYADLNNYQYELIDLFSKLKDFPEDKFYTNIPKVYKNGSRYLLAARIAQEQPTLESVKAEIKEKLIKAAVTTAAIDAELITLRNNNDLVIYDNMLETTYVSLVQAAKLTFATTKKTNEFVVCKTNVASYTADDLFEKMNRRYGINITVAELDYLRLINSYEFNQIYNINTNTVIDQTAWDVILQQVKDEKANFNNNVYVDYGYPKSYGWTNFLKDIYSVENEQELAEYYLYLEIRDRFTSSLGDLTDATETSPLWLFYQNQMQKIVDDYYKVTGVHLLLAVYEGSNMLDPKDWTENQIAMAKEFNQAIMNYLKTETGTYVEKLQALELAYNKAPLFVASKPQTTAGQDVIPGISYTFKGIEVSKYKTAGITILYQDLGTFANGAMVEGFSNAVRTVWQDNPSSKTPTVYGLNPVGSTWSYIVTEFGYHIYVNLESFPLTGWETGKYIPTLEHIQLFLVNNNTTALSVAQKSAVNTYYSPINTELVGQNSVAATSYLQMMDASINFHMTTFTNAEFLKQMTAKYETFETQLKYK